jgi:hypothetical protein
MLKNWVKNCRTLLTDERMNCYCWLFKMNKKFSSLYKNLSHSSIYWFSSSDSSRFIWRSRSSFVTKIFSSDQVIFVFRCHFDLISSKSRIYLRIHWSLDDLENQKIWKNISRLNDCKTIRCEINKLMKNRRYESSQISRCDSKSSRSCIKN